MNDVHHLLIRKYPWMGKSRRITSKKLDVLVDGRGGLWWVDFHLRLALQSQNIASGMCTLCTMIESMISQKELIHLLVVIPIYLRLLFCEGMQYSNYIVTCIVDIWLSVKIAIFLYFGLLCRPIIWDSIIWVYQR